MNDVTGYRDTLNGLKLPEYAKEQAITISSKCPDKWVFVDGETGHVWRWDTQRGTMVEADNGILEGVMKHRTRRKYLESVFEKFVPISDIDGWYNYAYVTLRADNLWVKDVYEYARVNESTGAVELWNTQEEQRLGFTPNVTGNMNMGGLTVSLKSFNAVRPPLKDFDGLFKYSKKDQNEAANKNAVYSDCVFRGKKYARIVVDKTNMELRVHDETGNYITVPLKLQAI